MKRILSAGLSLALGISFCLTPAAALTAQQTGELLDQYYVDTVPDSVLGQEDVDSMLEALGDPYTVYMTKEEYDAFLNSVNGETLVGIGVSIQNAVTENGFLILSILPDSPAQKAGLEEGDYIQAIDGVAVTSPEQSASLAGQEGSKVTVTVLSGKTGKTRELTLTRQKVQVPIVTYSLVDGAAVIECISFGDTTAQTISQALTEYKDLDRPIILDLRSNPGGVTDAAAGSASYFTGSGVMAFFRNGEGRYTMVKTDSQYPDLTDQSLIILTDSNSASASELFSAAIRDYRAGIAVGERTYGKGIAQIVLDEETNPELFDGDALKVTSYRFYSPFGVTNDTIGVLPTLMISQEYAPAAAMLLTASQPKDSQGYWMLNLASRTFYISQEQAGQAEYRDAFDQLLEALPPSAQLKQGLGGSQWITVSPAYAAQSLGLSYDCRWNYNDLDQCVYADDVATLSVYGLLGGFPDGSFRAQQSITRGEFAVLLSAALNLRESHSAGFADVPSNAWYADAVDAMVAKGFLAGRSSTTFAPQDNLTYEELVTILSAVSSWVCTKGYAVADTPVPADQQSDYAAFSSWAQAPAWRLSTLGVPLDRTSPQTPAIRDQAAHLIFQFLQAAGLLWNV